MMWFLLGMLAGGFLWTGLFFCFAFAYRRKKSAEGKTCKEKAISSEAEGRPTVFRFRRTGRIRPSRKTLTDRYRAFLLE